LKALQAAAQFIETRSENRRVWVVRRSISAALLLLAAAASAASVTAAATAATAVSRDIAVTTMVLAVELVGQEIHY